MSWLNLNQSLSSLKGQITNFATEVLTESVGQNNEGESSRTEATEKELEEKCRNQELEITALKKLTEELQTTLQSERLARKNGVKEEESSWYWDPSPQVSRSEHEIEKQYKLQIQALQSELSNLKDREPPDQTLNNEEELNRLREENKNLTCSLEELDSQHQTAIEKLLKLKEELQENFVVLKEEHEDLQSASNDFYGEICYLRDKVDDQSREIDFLKLRIRDNEQVYIKYQNLEKVHSLLRENAEKFQEENQNLHEEVFKLQEKVSKLEHDIEIATKHTETTNVPREQYDQLLKEINDLKHNRNSDQIQLDEINIDDNAKSVIETLKREINELKRTLSQRDCEHHEAMETKFIKQDKILQLYNRYVNFELPIDFVGEIPSGSENVVVHMLESVFKTLNSFKKDIDALEHELSEKKTNITNLQTQIEDVITENEYLTSDIQHLERELEEMKKNNDFLISEIAALKNTSKLEPIIETHEDNLAKLETELADCNRINKTFESEIKRIESELNDVQTEKKILQESLNDMKSKYTTMLTELKICKTQTQAVQELENNANVTQNVKLQQTIDEIDDLKKSLNSAHSKNEQLSIDIHIMENDKVLLTKHINDVTQEKQAIEDSHKKLELSNESLDSKLKDLESKLSESYKSKQNLEQKLKAIENEVIEANKKQEAIEKENITLKETLKTAESINSSITDIEKISTEKSHLVSKLDEILEQNSTLKEKIASLTNEILKLHYHQEELANENSLLNQKNLAETNSISNLHLIINDLKSQISRLNATNNELLTIRDENKELLETKLQLEEELSTTNKKIEQLKEKFEKLHIELNDKDLIIDNLNLTNSKNKAEIENLTRNINELTSSNDIKSQEIARVGKNLDETTQNLSTVTLISMQNSEELRKLHVEKEELNKQIYGYNDEINTKNIHISKLTSAVQELEKSYTESKILIDSRDKEVKELNKSLLDLKDQINASENITLLRDHYAKLLEEKHAIEISETDLRNNLAAKENELLEMQNRVLVLENTCKEYKTIIDNITIEKTELINLVNLKHNESIQYHTEIQRLNQVLLEQSNEFKRVIEEKDILLKNHSDIGSSCDTLRSSLKEKDEIIMALNQNSSEHERLKTELLNASETVKMLTKRCEDLDRNITIQSDSIKKLTADNTQLSEQEQNSSRELERLRRHLVETEESYTQELMTSEQKLAECQTRLHQVEERAKQTSTVYTSNSIRANQEVETLRTQIKLLERQREEAQVKLSEADDARSRSEAALTNLQVVLEQFQLDKERDIHAATEKIRNKMGEVTRQNELLQHEIARLNAKLEESIAGLQAATRLGDQVETKSAQINDLKEQVRTLQTSITAAEERYYNAISNQQDKVDKNLVKNLVVNYVLTANHSDLNRTQILRVLSTVLDFNQTECEKLGLVRTLTQGDSLAAEFVKFLHNESRPRAALPDMMGLQGGRATPVSSSRKSSTIGPHPVFEVGHMRNPSTGSNNLLFQNLDSMETSSQVSMESDTRVIPINAMETGINQTRNNEGAILKHVLKDM